MATWKSAVGNQYQLQLVVWVTSQDVYWQTSNASWVLELIKGDYYYVAPHIGNVIFNGKQAWNANATVPFGGYPSRSKVTVASGSDVYRHNSNGNYTLNVSAKLRTVDQLAAWRLPPLTISGYVGLPNIPRRPGRPSTPYVSQNMSTRKITVGMEDMTEPLVKVTGYQVRLRDNNHQTDWLVRPMDLSTRSYTFIPFKPITRYDFQVRAGSKIGWGLWSEPYVTILGTGSGPKIRVGGVWRDTNAYVKDGGVWKPVICYGRTGSKWKLIGR